MKILIAPDSFKGSLTALEAAEAMRRGVLEVFTKAQAVCLPVSDGGEGLVETLVSGTAGRFHHLEVSGPLGERVLARWGELGGKGGAHTAVVEMASASGLTLVPEDRREPGRSDSLGTGELILEVLNRGFKRLILGLGGSATNDGGTGAARALGVRFLDAGGRELPPGPQALSGLASIDTGGLDPRVNGLEILIASDVTNPLCGPDGATAVFGPQKGVRPEQTAGFDAALRRYGQIAEQATGRKVMDRPGAGAAGGLGAGLLFFTPATIQRGIELVLDALDFDRQARDAWLVITGEGRTDAQTAFGKAPAGVAARAKKWNVPVVCLSGGLGPGYREVYRQGVDAAMPVVPSCMAVEECMAAGPELVADAAARLCRLLRAGMNLGGTPEPK